MHSVYDASGNLLARWDNDTRTVTEYDAGNVTSVRPYNAEENAAADAAQAAKLAQENEATLREQARTALNSLAVTADAMRTIRQKNNNQIGPNDTKDVANAVVDVAQTLRRVIRLVVGALETME